MSIHNDARQGTLTGTTLTRYVQNNPNVLSEQDPSTGWAPLSTGAVAGFADVVDQVLKRGAKADALSRNGETALLLATRETKTNRARIIQLILAQTPAGSIDATTQADGNTTPLMYSVLNKDLESIRLLVNAGASLTATNNKGMTAEQLANSDKAVLLALDPKKKESAFSRLTDMVGSFLLYIVSWVNKTADGVMNRLFGLNPKFDANTDEVSWTHRFPHLFIAVLLIASRTAASKLWRDTKQSGVPRKRRRICPKHSLGTFLQRKSHLHTRPCKESHRAPERYQYAARTTRPASEGHQGDLASASDLLR